jgi:RNA recognition motif-containing protein
MFTNNLLSFLRSRGFGFVCFENEADAFKAMAEMNGCNIAGKEIYVGLAQKKQERADLLAKEREVPIFSFVFLQYHARHTHIVFLIYFLFFCAKKTFGITLISAYCIQFCQNIYFKFPFSCYSSFERK